MFFLAIVMLFSYFHILAHFFPFLNPSEHFPTVYLFILVYFRRMKWKLLDYFSFISFNSSTHKQWTTNCLFVFLVLALYTCSSLIYYLTVANRFLIRNSVCLLLFSYQRFARELMTKSLFTFTQYVPNHIVLNQCFIKILF